MLSRGVWLLLEVGKNERGHSWQRAKIWGNHTCVWNRQWEDWAKSYSQLLFQATHLSHRHFPSKKRPSQAAMEGCRLAQVTRWPWIPESGRSVGWKETLSWPLSVHVTLSAVLSLGRVSLQRDTNYLANICMLDSHCGPYEEEESWTGWNMA